MPIVAWYLRKAELCAEMAKTAPTAGVRASYLHDEKLWLEIAATILSDHEKQGREPS
jgi:hypothetical protein